MFYYLDFEISRIPFEGNDFRKGKEFDVEMPADLDQFR